MKHSIPRTLLALGAGVVVQRLCQLVAFVLVGQALGVAGLGLYAQGQALPAVLAVLANAGVRNLTARTLAAHPEAPRGIVLHAVRTRLRLGAVAAGVVTLVAAIGSPMPWFWILCGLQVLPAAFDLKNLLDAMGRARREVAIETGVAVAQLLLVCGWVGLGNRELTVLAAIALACRCLYGVCAWPAIAALRGTAAAPPLPANDRAVATAQIAHELLAIGDVWLIAHTLGDAAAGYYAFAMRFAAAALMPSLQLARLLLPHLLHAGADGDPGRTLATALRATALVTLPVFGGGCAVALGLCELTVRDFGDAAPALRLLLLAGCLQHLGWQCSHALLALHRDRAYAHGLGWPAAGHALALLAVAILADLAPAAAATLAALVAVAANAAYAGVGLGATRSLLVRHRSWWHAPVLIAAATSLTAWSAGLVAPGLTGLLLQLLAGAGTMGLGLWFAELRGRWHRLGDGLAAASGFRS